MSKESDEEFHERLAEMFNRNHDEFLKFDAVENKKSKRPDLHGLMLLDSLCPDNKDIIVSAEHDEFYLSVHPEDNKAAFTEEVVIELLRSGIMYSEEGESFMSIT